MTEIKTITNKHTSCDWELSIDEIWLGNTRGIEIPEHYRSLKTIRIGEQAYDIHGKPLDVNHYRPLILHKSEENAYEAIYAKRMAEASRGYSSYKI